MYITFLIGNGFDLNLGLKTRYVDFYDFFKTHALENNVILRWIHEDDKNWADLELALGDKLQYITEDSLEQFMDSHDELDHLLLEYLESEQKRYDIDKIEEDALKELSRSLKNIPKELSEEERRSYEVTCKASASEEFQYWFVTFNYTATLDLIIEKATKAKIDLGTHGYNGGSKKHILGGVHHVHGTLSEGVVLGVNDESQINNEVLSKNELLKDTFLKARMNRQMGERRTERAEEIINNSQIICIFGMSIGVTDKRWWELLVTWLLTNGHRKLIIYTREHPNLFERKIPGRIIRAREKIRREFWNKGKGSKSEKDYAAIKSRIIVVFNSAIFSFPKVEHITVPEAI